MSKTEYLKSGEFYRRVAKKTRLKPNTARVYLAGMKFEACKYELTKGRTDAFFAAVRVGAAIKLLNERDIQKRGRKLTTKQGERERIAV